MNAAGAPVAAVTGAGRGLGLLITETLLAHGFRVVANHRSPSPELALMEAGAQGRLATVAGDISAEETAEKIAAQALAQFGGLDAVVNNAARTKDKALISMSPQDWDEVFHTNVRGAFLMTKHALRLMIRRRGGRLIYISSVSAVMGNAGQANYAASKYALHGLSNSVAQEYARYGVRTVVLAPGLIDAGLGAEIPPAVREVKQARSLAGLGAAADLAETVAFLAGPHSRYINATTLRLDGGMAY
jgi:3-oxoacyl-[acyl-carrier protein] reductase